MLPSDLPPRPHIQGVNGYYTQHAINYRITGWLKSAGTSGYHLVQTLCSKRDQLQKVSQSHVQMSFEYLQAGKLQNLSGQPVLMFDQPDNKKVFLMFRWNFLYFHLCLFPLVLSLDTTKKSLALSSLYPPIGYLYTLLRSP